MAIQIKYPSVNAVSVQLSASRGSPAKLFVTGGSAGGIPFSGRLIGSASEIAVGRNFTITEHIDNSIYLDQNNIILFRRGMPSRVINKCASIVVPQIIISGNASGASVRFRDVVRKFCVDRLAGVNTIGEEDWAESPCAGSQTRYSAKEALGIIGAPGGATYLCSYEGQYRSVLSSIYADMGCSYWWNFTGAGIGMICSAGGGNMGEKTGCNITSSINGSTMDGTRSHGSFTYAKEPNEEIRTANFQRTDWYRFTSTAYRGIIYPTYKEILRSIWGGIDAYQDLAAGTPPTSDYINGGAMYLIDIEEDDLLTAFHQKFSWDPNKTVNQNWSKILGLPELRTDAWGNIESADDVAAGSCFLVRKCPPKFFRSTQLEIFYPHESISTNFLKIAGGSESSFLKVQKTEITSAPAASLRGYDICGATPNDLLGNTAIGTWRSAQLWSPDDAEEGITDFSNSTLNLNLQEALADCVIGVNAEPWAWLEGIQIAKYLGDSDLKSKQETWNKYIEGDMEGTLRFHLKRGWSVVWVRPPRLSVSISPTLGVNCNDLQSVAGYVDASSVLEPPQMNVEIDELSGVCTSVIQEWIDEYGIIGDEDVNADDDYKPGLLSAVADGIVLKCGNASKIVIFPSFSPLQIVSRISTSFGVQAKLSEGKIGTGRWVGQGSLSSSNSLQHTISVTDITADNAGGVVNIPNNSGGGSIGYSKYTATDFCCPIDGLLESFNATIGTEGVSVSYSYRGVNPSPGISQIKVNNKTLSRGFVTV
jgi:hypothetical protein